MRELASRADAVLNRSFQCVGKPHPIRGFHAVNVLRGQPLIEIRSPFGVIADKA